MHLKQTVNLPALAYLISTSPAHAALVRSLIVPATWEKAEDKICNWSWSRSEDSEARSVLRAKCAECTSSEEETNELYGDIQSSENKDAIMAILLTSLRKLRQLNIRFSTADDHDDFRLLWPEIMNGIRSRRYSTAESTTIVETNSSQVAQLLAVPDLVDVMVRFTGQVRRYLNYSLHLASFFHLPNLRSIYGWKLGDMGDPPDWEDPKNPFAKLRPRSCPVEFIELRCSQLHKDHFQLMLDATIPGKLKTFSYEVGSRWSWCGTEHSAIMKSLQPHDETLEGLGLSHEDAYPYQSIKIRDKPYPCSFTSLVALKRLKIAPVYIWGHPKLIAHAMSQTPGRGSQDMLWSALPTSLEELWITRAQNQMGNTTFVSDCLLPALKLVAQNKRSAFPKLDYLRIELPLLNWQNEWLDDLASLCQLAAIEDMETTIIVCDMFDKHGPFTIERPWGWNEDIEWEQTPSRNSGNRGCAKVWIDATQQEHLADILKDMKAMFEEENARYCKARDAIDKLGPSFRDGHLNNSDYDASEGIGYPERYVDARLKKEPYWEGRGKETILHRNAAARQPLDDDVKND
ncbi:hypothetical protein G6011_03934 [Alternaria panax]|uniref:Uncharacterized protein n=1 Tax=Alternaria panax TaxID=48097 RepID=A0AAD4NTR1_9PLEO|nr:hypothetical protein G6011_03934 [Alternaria panax]